MDPISQGAMIFKCLADEFGSDPITESASIRKFGSPAEFVGSNVSVSEFVG